MSDYLPEMRRLTEEIRARLASIYEHIAVMNERKGYLALGYPTMVECMCAEFGFTPLDAIEMLEEALVWRNTSRSEV